MFCKALGLPLLVVGTAALRPSAEEPVQRQAANQRPAQQPTFQWPKAWQDAYAVKLKWTTDYLRAQQSNLARSTAKPAQHEETLHRRDLVFMHIPSNFGHSIEKAAMFRETDTMQDMLNLLASKGSSFEHTKAPLTWTDVMKVARGDAEVWGRLSPQLQVVSNVTGCNMYYTPQKYWPRGAAKRYFRNNTIFGVLRDPYERLVNLFREGRGGSNDKHRERCDVNNGVKNMMMRYMASGDKFMEGCALVPQAEYFDGPYGISLPIDNRKFIESANALFREHGYENLEVQRGDILPVRVCESVWAGDLDAETKKLVREVYVRDFELLCSHFGYCNHMENTCIEGIEGMCPPRVKSQIQMQRFWGFRS